MAATTDFEETFARVAITVMRHTGIRIGELLDLETDCVVDYGSAGRWLRVTVHQLRHTFATELVNAGMSLQALMALLGQSTAR